MNFHRDLMNDQERDEAVRDVRRGPLSRWSHGAAAALPALEDALAAWPDDVPAWEAKGYALGMLHRDQEGLAAFREALALEPNRESALTGAAYSAAHAGRRDDSIAYWNRAIARQPLAVGISRGAGVALLPESQLASGHGGLPGNPPP